jgi:hypothetical protein
VKVYRFQNFFCLFLLCLNFLGVPQNYFADSQDEWRPVSAEELAMKNSKVEADADAEEIFEEITIDDSPSLTTVWEHYVRIKIFNERGREKFAKIKIRVPGNGKVFDIKGRVVQPDGTIFELKKEDLFKQEIVRTKFARASVISFVVPNLEVGSIFEYKYKESSLQLVIGDRPLIFQREIPAQRMTYIFKPIQDSEVTKSFFNMTEPDITKDADGFWHITSTNIPALKTEPQMPPELESVRWMFVSYFPRLLKMNPEKFWETTAAMLSASFRLESVLKPDRKLRQKALEIVGSDAKTDEEKLSLLFEFCRTKINNVELDPKLTREQKQKFRLKANDVKAADSPHFTLKNAQGFSLEINELFAALAVSLGYEARYAFTGSRNEIFFAPKYKNRNLIHFACVAVKAGGKWLYFDPAETNVPFGMLQWTEENQPAILLGSTTFLWDKTPLSAPEKSFMKRRADLKISADNTLSGNVQIEYGGHFGVLLKDFLRDKTQGERENFIIVEAQTLINSAEIEGVTIENIEDKAKNILVSYKISVPNYSSRTGKRIFLRPNFFSRDAKPLFVSSERLFPASFDFPWSEQDEIEIEIPPDFTVENAESPTAMYKDANQAGSDFVKISVNPNGKIKCERKFVFGKNGQIYFPVESYPALKKSFDAFQKIDGALVSLRQR